MQDNINNININNRFHNKSSEDGGHFVWADEMELIKCKNAKAPDAIMASTTVSSSHCSTIPFHFVQKDRRNSDDRDDETTTTEEEPHTANSLCSSSSELRRTESETHFHSYIDKEVNLLAEHATQVFDQEITHTNASERILDVLPMTTLQIAQQSVLNTEIKNSDRDDPGGACGLPSTSAESEESDRDLSCHETQQINRKPEDSGRKDTAVVSSVAIPADVSVFSSSESSTLDSREASHSTTGKSLPNQCEDEFQKIVDDEIFQHPFNAMEYISSELAKSTVHFNSELEGSRISIDRTDERLMIEACNMRSSSRRAHILLKLGALQMKNGRVDVAIGSFARSVKEIQAATKKDVALALAANWLGIAFKSKNDWENAICCFRKAFAVRRRELGKDHVDTIESLNHLGSSLLHSGDVRGAQKCFRNVFWARKAVFGASHPGVALASHDLANVLSVLGDYSEAKKFYYTAWVIYHKLSLHKNHPSLVRLVQDIENLKEMTTGARAEV